MKNTFYDFISGVSLRFATAAILLMIIVSTFTRCDNTTRNTSNSLVADTVTYQLTDSVNNSIIFSGSALSNEITIQEGATNSVQGQTGVLNLSVPSDSILSLSVTAGSVTFISGKGWIKNAPDYYYAPNGDTLVRFHTHLRHNMPGGIVFVGTVSTFSK